MRKTLIILTTVLFSIQAYAGGSGTTTYGTNASFGTSPACSGKGICGTGASRGGTSIAVTFTYTASTMVFKIIITDQVLTDNGITIFNNPTYNFDQNWVTPADVAAALNNGNVLTIKAGQTGTVTDDGTNKTITYTLTP